MRSFNGNEAEAEVLYSPAAMKRTRVQRSPRKGKAVNRVVGLKKYRRRPKVKLSQFKPKSKGPCQRHDLYVSFEDIGWSSWIISPKGFQVKILYRLALFSSRTDWYLFQAYHCRGDCHFPIGQESKPSNHATVISIINHMKFHKRVSAPCCVPDKLYSISLLYFDNEQNVILKQYDDMVAQSCACRWPLPHHHILPAYFVLITWKLFQAVGIIIALVFLEFRLPMLIEMNFRICYCRVIAKYRISYDQAVGWLHTEKTHNRCLL